MSQTQRVHELRKGDRIEFPAGLGPPGIHVVIVAWGVMGTNGPVEPWMVATRHASGKVHNFTLDPMVAVFRQDR